MDNLLKLHSLEHFPNIRRLSKRRARWLFLDKKPLKHLLSVYTISANAIRPEAQRPTPEHGPLRLG
jgi:hypothetical protein